MLKDEDIRKPLKNKLIQQNTGNSYLMIEEMAVCDGLARVDIAVANGKLWGYEIKSDADSLIRLPLQEPHYSKTFDKMVVVIGHKFTDSIVNYIPDWWGVILARETKKKTVVLDNIRTAKQNPNISAESLLELLWAEELRSLLISQGQKGLSNKNRRILRQIAKDSVSLNVIKQFTLEALKTRENWRESI